MFEAYRVDGLRLNRMNSYPITTSQPNASCLQPVSPTTAELETLAWSQDFAMPRSLEAIRTI